MRGGGGGGADVPRRGSGSSLPALVACPRRALTPFQPRPAHLFAAPSTSCPHARSYERNFAAAFAAHVRYLRDKGAKGVPHKMD
jgi:hypothetical protein